MTLVRNVSQEPSGHQGRVGSVDDSASAIVWRLSRPGCPIFSLPLDADAFGVEKTGFARKLAARPQGAGGGCAIGRGLRILVSGSGGLGLRQGDGVYLLRSGLCRAMGTLGAAQTRQGTSGSLDSPFAAALLERGAAENRRLKRRPSPRGAVSSYQPRSETYRRSRAATKAAWAPSILRGSSCKAAQPPRVGSVDFAR